MSPIRVPLADDHALARLFRGLLRNLEGVEVVAEGGDGRTALELTGCGTIAAEGRGHCLRT
jgi:DNA-binding NarL/FixJ family response regulator